VRPSSGRPDVRDDRWGPPVSRARREGEGGAAGGVFLWGRWQSGRAPPARWVGREAEAQWVEEERPVGKKKKHGPRLCRKAGWAES
jgi:hypothetical protein